MRMRSIEDLDVSKKRVLVRVDYNVPLNERGGVVDNTRIKETLPTLRYLLSKRAMVILIAHLGRPKGKVNPKYSLQGVAEELSGLLPQPVTFTNDCIGDKANDSAQAMKPGDVLLCENLRFHSEEEQNDPAFARALAELGEVFVQEAFGAVHRAHASTVGVAGLLPSAAGYLIMREVDYLGAAITKPAKPFLAILGGAKVSDKINVITSLLKKVDALIIGGGMAYTFLHAQGIPIGKSLLEKDKLDMARTLLADAAAKKVDIILPVDHVVAQSIAAGASSRVTAGAAIDDGDIGVDIGPKTRDLLVPVIARAKTIVWNGPMGVFEIDDFAAGTMHVARQVAAATAAGAVSIVGGGDSVAAVRKSGVAGQISHISTGGGASLEFLEGKTLPGLAAIAAKD